MIPKVIAMLFVCTLLVHTIYSKTRLMDETTTNRDSLNVVGCKVQDLELKVNILTYKMQYGTWPLPRHIRAAGIEGGLRNVRLTLTNSQDRNAWLKHMLLRYFFFSEISNSIDINYNRGKTNILRSTIGD